MAYLPGFCAGEASQPGDPDERVSDTPGVDRLRQGLERMTGPAHLLLTVLVQLFRYLARDLVLGIYVSKVRPLHDEVVAFQLDQIL